MSALRTWRDVSDLDAGIERVLARATRTGVASPTRAVPRSEKCSTPSPPARPCCVEHVHADREGRAISPAARDFRRPPASHGRR